MWAPFSQAFNPLVRIRSVYLTKESLERSEHPFPCHCTVKFSQFGMMKQYVDVMAVIVVATSVTRQYRTKRAITSKSKEDTAQTKLKSPEKNKHWCTRKINMWTPCVKNHSRNNKRTTSAEDTQNQHYQRVLTLQITTKFGRASIAVTSSHRDTDIHQQITINFGRASITACVTESTRVLDELLRDEGFNLCFSSLQ